MNKSQIEDALYLDFSFRTGGLRGTIGAGTNRMNVYTVAKASQGLSEYIKERYENLSAVIGYNTRIKSDIFARVFREGEDYRLLSANETGVLLLDFVCSQRNLEMRKLKELWTTARN